MPPAGLVLSVLSNPHASVLASPKWCFNIRFQLSSGISKMHNFKSAFRKKYFGARAAEGPHPNEAPVAFLSVACHNGHSAGDAPFNVGLARAPCPGMCIINSTGQQKHTNGNCKLAKSQKETNTNNRSGHARQRGEQRSRCQRSPHLFRHCHSHSPPQCRSCPLHRICVLRPQINDVAGLPTGRNYILRRLHNEFHGNRPGGPGLFICKTRVIWDSPWLCRSSPVRGTYILHRLQNQFHGNLSGGLCYSHATGRRTCPPLPARIARRRQISLKNHTIFACLRQVWF